MIPASAGKLSEETRRALEQVIRECKQTRDVFRQTILDLPDEKVEAPFIFPWGPTGTLEDMVAIFAEHDIEHAQEIRNNHLNK